MKVLSILLQATSGGNSGMMSILMIVLLFVIMYFFMIRPQQKKQKEVQKMREALKVGDRVVTSGGIFGKIKEIEDTAFIIEIAEGVKVKVDKASIFAATNDSQTAK
ncbi:MAG: preprotein translocase subunit YajC [Candidatus Azobacteroides sp.]|nr:preprotein translocase subunit YajC [Candidatus Azobacteroides sp.]